MKRKRSPQQRATLRCCASCEWIWRRQTSYGEACPKCGFGSYGARAVFGDRCYRYAKTQEPWMKKKLGRYEAELQKEIQRGTA